ncbi:MAG TPA: tetratricopeptide repeat protein, partial [Herpetosiphonaceae bacterium]|nr:tetratricopeptide repeat protein [Herpetosiphonaceae bacterium]
DRRVWYGGAAAVLALLLVLAAWSLTRAGGDSSTSRGTGDAPVKTASVYEQELATAEATLAQNSQDFAALLGRGQALLGLGRYQEAVDALTAALSVRTDDLVALLARAEASAGAGEWDLVIDDTSRILALDKTSLPALLLRARAAREQGDVAAAERDYATAVAAHGDDPVVYRSRAEHYLMQDQLTAAHADLQKALALDDQDPDTWVMLGTAYITWSPTREQQPDRAIDAFTRALLIDPQNVPAFVNRGRTYLDFTSDPERARADLSRAIEIGPATAQMYEIRSRTTDEPSGRLADLDRAVAVDTNEPVPYVWRAEHYFRHNDIARAIVDYSAAIERAPEDWEYYVERSNLYLVAGKYDEAAADAQQVLDGQPESASGHHALARVRFVQGDYEQALAEANLAVDTAEVWDRPLALAQRGRIYVRLDRPDEALRDLDEADKLEQATETALFGRAELLIARREYDAALTLLDDWSGFGSPYGAGYVLRAQIYLAQGTPRKAGDDLTRAHELVLYPDEVRQATALAEQIG